MKKFFKPTAYLLILMPLFIACKSNQEVYNATYERAKAKQEAIEATQADQNNTENIEVVEKSSVKEASESIDIIGTASDGNYGVVVGSFINRTNAESLMKRMQDAGYKNAVLGQNEKLMYRVIVAFYTSKADAQAKVKDLKSEFPDAWILIKE